MPLRGGASPLVRDGGTGQLGGSCEAGANVPRRFPTVHICAVDYACQVLVGEDGREYRELPDSSWIEIGPVREGSVRYWGSGSHAGHINLLPLAYYSSGEWVNVLGA